MKFFPPKLALLWVAAVLSWGSMANVMAQEAAIRKNLSERLPNLPKIDEVSKTPMNGLFEIRMGNEVMYSDADGNFLIQGALIDVRQRRNLTEERWRCSPTPLAAFANVSKKTCKNWTT
jgi:thiol:disulfide interchange protein DsbC